MNRVKPIAGDVFYAVNQQGRLVEMRVVEAEEFGYEHKPYITLVGIADNNYSIMAAKDFDAGDMIYHWNSPENNFLHIQEYQHLALSTFTMKSTDQLNAIMYAALALNGEAGEIAEKVKKVLRDKRGNFEREDFIALAYELGDVLWYVAVMAHLIGFSLIGIMKMNIKKLANRKSRNVLHGSGDNR
jgi:NTP pyrophosphatase (non-canonical NTP hydrolase)